MFRTYTWIITSCLTVVALFWLFQLVYVRQSDVTRYFTRIEKLQKLSEQPLFSTAQQTRKQVRKELWISQPNHTRLQHWIDSESSILTLQPSKGRSLDVIEQLFHISCTMQEKIYPESGRIMQQIRILQAEEGTYLYKKQSFVADSVYLSLFRLPGDLLPKNTHSYTPFLKGKAKDITFSIHGNTPQFEARNFQATLKPTGEL